MHTVICAFFLTKYGLRLTYLPVPRTVRSVCPQKPIRLITYLLRSHHPQLSVRQYSEATYSSSSVYKDFNTVQYQCQPFFYSLLFYSLFFTAGSFFYSHCEQTVTPLRSRSVPHCPALLPDSHRILTPAQTRHNTLHQSPLFSSLSHPPFTLLTRGHEKRYNTRSSVERIPGAHLPETLFRGNGCTGIFQPFQYLLCTFSAKHIKSFNSINFPSSSTAFPLIFPNT